ncbi:MAG: 4Fe-4S dicluster domain-containing protein [Promethearchaeota archaeon]|jgi:molybdopterin-containing oxidoreductase family iron-sulfur binding subunit
MVKFAYAVDLNRCLGCRACVEACKVENNTPMGAFWMHVFREEKGIYPNVRVEFTPRPCMHCDNAPCVKVCPVGARYNQENGLVLTDFERCIGCRLCQVSCPYGVNYFNWKDPKNNQYYSWNDGEGDDVYGSGKLLDEVKDSVPPWGNPDLKERFGNDNRLVAGGSHFKGVMGKCTWCVHRIENGKNPACVEICPFSALHFGDLDDPNSEISKLLGTRRKFRMLEELGTKPRVYYMS